MTRSTYPKDYPPVRSRKKLYGSAPEKMSEETASLEETKEYIGEQIQELEKMEIKEGEENETDHSNAGLDATQFLP